MWELRYGVHYMYSDDCRLQNNTSFDNDVGYALMLSKHLDIEDNVAVNNSGQSGHGILVRVSTTRTSAATTSSTTRTGCSSTTPSATASSETSSSATTSASTSPRGATDGTVTETVSFATTAGVAVMSDRSTGTKASGLWSRANPTALMTTVSATPATSRL